MIGVYVYLEGVDESNYGNNTASTTIFVGESIFLLWGGAIVAVCGFVIAVMCGFVLVRKR